MMAWVPECIVAYLSTFQCISICLILVAKSDKLHAAVRKECVERT